MRKKSNDRKINPTMVYCVWEHTTSTHTMFFESWGIFMHIDEGMKPIKKDSQPLLFRHTHSTFCITLYLYNLHTYTQKIKNNFYFSQLPPCVRAQKKMKFRWGWYTLKFLFCIKTHFVSHYWRYTSICLINFAKSNINVHLTLPLPLLSSYQ
jgi:hypothetical protein